MYVYKTHKGNILGIGRYYMYFKSTSNARKFMRHETQYCFNSFSYRGGETLFKFTIQTTLG